MSSSLGVARLPNESVAAICARSRDALDRPLAFDAELSVSEVLPSEGEWLVLGAFQRGVGLAEDRPLVRRGSGGASVVVAPGTLHVALSLAHPSALVPCDASKLVNRYVRPLLRALSKVGATAHYFGRDWVSVMHRPAASVGFAHDATSGRAMIEAFVAVRAPFAAGERASFQGKPPGTLESITGASIDMARLGDAVIEAYAKHFARDVAAFAVATPGASRPHTEAELRKGPPWRAVREEAIGVVAAGPDGNGVLRLGGDFMASRDAVARLESRVASLAEDAPVEAIARVVREVFDAPDVALDGVRSLESLADVLARGRR